jgi:hypothetical protein
MGSIAVRFSTLAIRLAWLSMAPFDSPVVPDV